MDFAYARLWIFAVISSDTAPLASINHERRDARAEEQEETATDVAKSNPLCLHSIVF